jgi:hypothetical protein
VIIIETELIKLFVDAENSAKDSMSKGDVEAATKKYEELLGLYNLIKSSSLEQTHKEIAYKELIELRRSISTAPSKSEGAKTVHIALGVLIVLLCSVVVFKPNLLGLVVHENTVPVWQGPAYFTIYGTTTIDVSQYFFDAEQDELTFISTNAPGLDVQVAKSMITLVPQRGITGSRTITLMAYDGSNVARKTVSIIVN